MVDADGRDVGDCCLKPEQLKLRVHLYLVKLRPPLFLLLLPTKLPLLLITQPRRAHRRLPLPALTRHPLFCILRILPILVNLHLPHIKINVVLEDVKEEVPESRNDVALSLADCEVGLAAFRSQPADCQLAENIRGSSFCGCRGDLFNIDLGGWFYCLDLHFCRHPSSLVVVFRWRERRCDTGGHWSDASVRGR